MEKKISIKINILKPDGYIVAVIFFVLNPALLSLFLSFMVYTKMEFDKLILSTISFSQICYYDNEKVEYIFLKEIKKSNGNYFTSNAKCLCFLP
jgi:hypothetical protein